MQFAEKVMSMRGKTSRWVLSAAVSFGVGSLLGCNTHSPSVNAAKPSDAQPLFTPQAANLPQQKMCDEQAGRKFHEFGYGKSDDYTSHYDPTVNVCYIRIHSVGTNPAMVADVVYDAFGGREYGNYTWMYSEVAPTTCEIRIPGKPVEKCNSPEEFDRLTEKYFGVAR